MNKYYTTIGLEIHAELKTKTKMFCACINNPDEKNPNTNICPVCMAHPGTLPVVNKKAVENVVKVGLALDANIADFTEFDRKNYFYPDIPKGYQISQYKYPIVSGGHLADFDVTRVHLEEDTANNKHDRGDYSLIDFNRAGVPLMELVTEPHTFASSEEASAKATFFAKELQLLLWYLGVSEANMEKGEMRVEANISVSSDKEKFGTKVEVKNLNSFRSVERAIKYETDRMIKILEEGKGEGIVQETRGWDENKQLTFSQRKKETSQDYRYFPDPDIPKFNLHKLFNMEEIHKSLPELPAQKRARYKKDFDLKDEDVETFINDMELAEWFQSVVVILNDVEKIKIAVNYITSDLLGLKKNNADVKYPNVKNFAELIEMVFQNQISSRVAKDLLIRITKDDMSPKEIAEKEDLLQKNDTDALTKIAQDIIEKNPKVVEDYKNGKENALMSLVGQIMKETKGSANPSVAKEILSNLLK
ncbi:MAG: Asp-tRNA(Asn)/Glu-tRNA(Gln) amidotransferase subunit GatB [Candidatus Pacebacteria bacterium]|nr:Asp-tRNA(Asn)/Glu-tRNA(Gln) amidotransferase subunit GatB [Candidatus Paceibacterota bacterium]MCF7863137.1 Asp-tRNA(Asn)/Glu-tRNA(Gln) amidotransferase subunit GatB [Candidatus Paceibacterota bacterium]